MERLSVEDAAQRLDLSVSTVRRRIRDGTLQTEREATAQGFKYWVILEERPATAPTQPEAEPSDELAAVIAERDWLRARVEELTALLNREQETALRLSLALGQRPAIESPAATQPPTQPDRRPDQAPPPQRGAIRRTVPWWRRLLFGG